MICFEDFHVGDTEVSGEVSADQREMIAYARENDPFPIHTDPEAAAQTVFGGIIAPWGYTVSLFFRAAHTMRFNRESRDAFLGRPRMARDDRDHLAIRNSDCDAGPGRRPRARLTRGLAANGTNEQSAIHNCLIGTRRACELTRPARGCVWLRSRRFGSVGS
jgi:hypothetical protein